MNDFYENLKVKGSETYKVGMYLSVNSPYFARNIKLERTFGKKYSIHNIQDRIYYGEKTKIRKVVSKMLKIVKNSFQSNWLNLRENERIYGDSIIKLNY